MQKIRSTSKSDSFWTASNLFSNGNDEALNLHFGTEITSFHSLVHSPIISFLLLALLVSVFVTKGNGKYLDLLLQAKRKIESPRIDQSVTAFFCSQYAFKLNRIFGFSFAHFQT